MTSLTEAHNLLNLLALFTEFSEEKVLSRCFSAETAEMWENTDVGKYKRVCILLPEAESAAFGTA